MKKGRRSKSKLSSRRIQRWKRRGGARRHKKTGQGNVEEKNRKEEKGEKGEPEEDVEEQEAKRKEERKVTEKQDERQRWRRPASLKLLPLPLQWTLEELQPHFFSFFSAAFNRTVQHTRC